MTNGFTSSVLDYKLQYCHMLYVFVICMFTLVLKMV